MAASVQHATGGDLAQVPVGFMVNVIKVHFDICVAMYIYVYIDV